MKFKIIALSTLAVISISCGSGSTADPHAGHDHEKTETSSDGHNHAEGESCSGEDGHAHEAAKPADDGHNHAEGESCSGEDSHAHEAAKPTDDGHNHAEGESCSGEDEHAEGIQLPQSQADELGITYRKVTTTPFQGVIHTSGIIEPAPNDATTVVATTSGTVSFGGVPLTEGRQITAGSKLLTITSSDMTDGNLNVRLSDARAALVKAEADYKRISELRKEKLATAADFEAARYALEQAQQSVNSLSRNTSSTGSRNIISSKGGYITSLNVKDGDYVSEGQPLATISENRNLVLRADLPQRHFAELHNISSANFRTPYDNKSYDISELGGRLLSAGRSTASAGEFTLPVRFSIENRSSFVPGAVVDVYLKSSSKGDRISVPESALTEEQGAKYVYLRIAPETYVKRHVVTGRSNGRDVEIISGLTPGEEVVASGAYFVRMAAMSGAIPDGHNH